jgi:chromosome segregation ATPase
MAEINPAWRAPAAADGDSGLPEVCLEVGNAAARATLYVVSDAGFVIGAVPGCDLRIPGKEGQALLCLIARHPAGASIRKLSPTQPLLVNGKSCNASLLKHGDRVQVGPVDLVVQVFPASAAALPAVSDPDLQRQLQQFREQLTQFQRDKQRFDEDAAKTDRALTERESAIGLREQQLAQLEQTRAGQPALDDVAKQAEGLAAQRQELALQRQELADIRTQLYDRYRERRDRLAGLQESVNKAARKVQERKQLLDVDVRDWEQRRAELASQAADLRQAQDRLGGQRQQREADLGKSHDELAERTKDLERREHRLKAERQALEPDQARLKEDLLRLDRLRAELDEREKEIESRNRDVDERVQQLQSETKEMEAHVVQLDEWQTKLTTIGEKLAKQKADQDEVGQQLAQRTAALEGQQVALATLRARLERMREETRQQEQQLAAERAHHDAAEAEFREKQQGVTKLRQELDADRALLDQERRMFTDRSAVLDKAVTQLREAQDRIAAEEQRIGEHTQALEKAGAGQAEQAGLLQGRIDQYDELTKRLQAERDNLRERTLQLAQAEQARETLQEQLRRRSEDLLARQKALTEQIARHEAEVASLQGQRDSIAEQQQKFRDQLAAERHKIEQRSADFDKLQADLAARTATLQQAQQRLVETNQAFAEESQEFAQERAKFDAERGAAEEARADLEAAKREAVLLRQQLPDLELRAGTSLERLTHVREQMRDHLDEVHTYAGQCRDELEAVRTQVRGEADRLQQQEQALRRGQDEQRLAIAAFRQQLIAWQGQIEDMKRLMAHDESRLEKRQAQVAEQTRQLGADTVRLAHQAEQLQEKEREVAEKRAEMDRHLGDMREWYRRKMRELAGIREPDDMPDAPADVAQGRDILSLTGDVDPIDQKLGDLMRSLDLIEADTLTALLVEARRQRRSLRQVLLASGAVTLYQMALIEAGNLDGLMLGPVRVVDRLRVTPRESVYRVFDPRRGTEAILRQLAESEGASAGEAEEFRQRFTQAMLAHPNLAATLEVLEIAGRPAVLQEWLVGLPGNDWPALAAVPGVWYRLVLQAAQALHAAHEIELVHGHLQPAHFLLTPDGVLKVSGFGEPPWLLMTPASFGGSAASDVLSLGVIACEWCAAARRKAARGKPLPDALQMILDRMCMADGDRRLLSAAAVLDELEKAAAAVPANPEAWDRLVKHVKENAMPLATLRQSA